MDRALVGIAFASIAGVAILWGVAQTSEFPLVPVADLGAHAGTTVRVEGRLLEVRDHPNGFARALLVAGDRSVPLLSRNGIPAASGDVVRVEARVLHEQGRLELEVEHREAIEIVAPWQENSVSLERLLADPWSHRSSNVRTWGLVETQARTTWLRSNMTEAAVALVGAPPGHTGSCAVEGFFAYEAERASFRLQVAILDCPPTRVA